MSIVLRPVMNLRDDTDIIIHMGSGEAKYPVASAIRNYDAYGGVIPGRDDGSFMISTYAVVDGVTEFDIVTAMPQPRFARARLGDLDGLEIYPTSMDAPGMPVAVMAVHFDIRIPDGGWSPPQGRADQLTAQEVEIVTDLLTGPVEEIMSRFAPLPPRNSLNKRAIYPHLPNPGGS